MSSYTIYISFAKGKDTYIITRQYIRCSDHAGINKFTKHIDQ